MLKASFAVVAAEGMQTKEAAFDVNQRQINAAFDEKDGAAV